MRILLYIEPHPIRGSHTIFNDVARKFLPLLARSTAEFDVRMYVTSHVVRVLGNKAIAGVEERLIRATAKEEALFEANLSDWETDGIPAWLDLMGGGEAADDYVEVLRRIWRVFPYDVIVHWSENGAVTRFLQERPVTRIGMELGCTRDPFFSSVVLDPFGTNGNGIVPRLTLEQLREVVGDKPMSADEALFAHSANLEALPYEQQFFPLDSNLSGQILETARKVAFLPLQLHDDANLLRFSPYDTVEEVVLDTVPKLAEAGYVTIVKTHPGAKTRNSSRAAFSLARAALRPWAEHVVWLDSLVTPYSNTQLMALADLVVTVNSSVGFEALYFDKVVSVLGDAVYKPAGLFPTLDEAMTGDFDLDAYHHGTGLLRRFMLDGYLVKDTIRGDAPVFQDIVTTIDAVCRHHGHAPERIAGELYRAFSLTRGYRSRSRMVAGGSAPGAGEFGIPAIMKDSSAPGSSLEGVGEAPRPEYVGPARRLISFTGASSSDEFRNVVGAGLADSATAERFVRASGLVDSDYYLRTYRDVAKAGKDPVEHWANYGLHWERHRLRGGRSPREGIEVTTVSALVDELATAAGALLDGKGVPRFPLEDEEETSRQQELAALHAKLELSQRKTAVIAHLYYRHLVPEILGRLKTIPEAFDLIVTVPNWGNAQIIEMVREAYPDAIIYAAPSRGRDLGPFLDVLKLVAERDYDAVLRVHTKADFFQDDRLRRDIGEMWRSQMLDALLGSSERVAEIIAALRDRESALIGAREHYLSLEDDPYADGGEFSASLLDEPGAGGYFYGSSFWFRPSALRSLVEPGALDLTCFPGGVEDEPIYGLVERLLTESAGNALGGASCNHAEQLADSVYPAVPNIVEYLETALVEQRAALAETPNRALAW